MNGELRREHILAALALANEPVAAGQLARELAVSRQVIVGDVALLRARGANILATPRGYTLREGAGLLRMVACRHTGEEMLRELYCMVDNGARVENVIVEHPLYGQLEGQLQIASRFDADAFAARMRESAGAPLSSITGGVHLHALLVQNEETFTRVKEALKREGFLYEEE